MNRLSNLFTQEEAAPKSGIKILALQVFVAVVTILATLYQGLVVLPAMTEVKHVFEIERDKEVMHAKKIEALRRSQVTENALLLMDVRESRRLMLENNLILKGK